jgi:Arc/MetJ-type ribon-helix-helix transcriptional regulator
MEALARLKVVTEVLLVCHNFSYDEYYSKWYGRRMKVSVSLPEDDIRFLDSYTSQQGYSSRSAALHRAVTALRSDQLAGAYEDAWREWDESGEADIWAAVTADGLEP